MASVFPDPKTIMQFADIFYRGSLVNREHQVAVDKGRALLTAGRTRPLDSGARTGEDAREVVTPAWEVDFARLVHSFLHREEDFDVYLSQAGHAMLPDVPTTFWANDADYTFKPPPQALPAGLVRAPPATRHRFPPSLALTTINSSCGCDSS